MFGRTLSRGDIWRLSEAELRVLVQAAYDNTNDYAPEPPIDEKRKELRMEPDEIRADIEEWFEDIYVHDNVDEIAIEAGAQMAVERVGFGAAERRYTALDMSRGHTAVVLMDKLDIVEYHAVTDTYQWVGEVKP